MTDPANEQPTSLAEENKEVVLNLLTDLSKAGKFGLITRQYIKLDFKTPQDVWSGTGCSEPCRYYLGEP